MKRVRIMRGLPGSGKSTRATKAAEEARARGELTVVVGADHYFTRPDGSYEFRGNKLTEAHRECFSKFVDALFNHTHLVIVDNTNIKLDEFDLYLKVALLAGYAVEIDEVKPKDGNEIKAWHARCVHGVPLDKMQSRWSQWEDLPRSWTVTFING